MNAYLPLMLCAVASFSQAQTVADTLHTSGGLGRYSLETGGVMTTPGVTPFWFRANRSGVVPLNGSFGFMRASASGHVGKADPQRWAFRYGLDAVVNAGSLATLQLPEAYLSAERRHLKLEVGRWRQVLGVGDSLLSSGAFSMSDNALPLPRIQISTNGFAPLKFTRGVLAVNANLAHGWFGNTGMIQGSFLHQKAIYFRVGKPNWAVKFVGGATHVAQWGGRTSVPYIGKDGRLPSSLTDYAYVFSVVTPPESLSGTISRHDSENRYGNHLGSVDFGFDVSLPQASLLLYVQRPYDDDTGVLFMNLPDGLYGIRWKNQPTQQQHGFRLQQLTAEFFTTLNQSGFEIGGGHFQGADDYYNNYQFRDGWIYRDHIIGSPFITRSVDSRSEFYNLPGGTGSYLPINNNRVQVMHLGLKGGWTSGSQIRAMVSQSRNYGRPMRPAPIVAYAQFSGLVELIVPVQWLGGLYIQAAVAADYGKWLNNSIGGWLSIRKTGFYR